MMKRKIGLFAASVMLMAAVSGAAAGAGQRAGAATVPSCTGFTGTGACDMTAREQVLGQGSGRVSSVYTENAGTLSDVLRLYKPGVAYASQFTVKAATTGGWIYPNIGYGAERGMRPPYAWAPVRIGYNGNSAGYIWMKSGTSLTSSGSWNACFDIWYEPHYDYTGAYQSVGGTEMMIWNEARRGGRIVYDGPGYYYGRVSLDGNTWNVNASVVSLNGHTWHRIYFVAVHPGTFFNGPLNPFMARAGRLGYLVSSEYLTGLDYGFEVNQGGPGLSVTRLSVTGVR